jgi:hypothetical protein
MNCDLLVKANVKGGFVVFRPIGLILKKWNRAGRRLHERNVVATWEQYQQLLKDRGKPTTSASRPPLAGRSIYWLLVSSLRRQTNISDIEKLPHKTQTPFPENELVNVVLGNNVLTVRNRRRLIVHCVANWLLLFWETMCLLWETWEGRLYTVWQIG